jgi:hypothetical protein
MKFNMDDRKKAVEAKEVEIAKVVKDLTKNIRARAPYSRCGM